MSAVVTYNLGRFCRVCDLRVIISLVICLSLRCCFAEKFEVNAGGIAGDNSVHGIGVDCISVAPSIKVS